MKRKRWAQMVVGERVDVVRSLAVKGESASSIAKMLGSSRSAVCGLVWRYNARVIRKGTGDALINLGGVGKGKAQKARRIKPAARTRPVPKARPAVKARPAAKVDERPSAEEARETVLRQEQPAPTEAAVSLFDARVGVCRRPLWQHGAAPEPDEALVCGRPVYAEGAACCAECRGDLYTSHRIEPRQWVKEGDYWSRRGDRRASGPALADGAA